MPELMRDVLYVRMLMEHHNDDGVMVFTSQKTYELGEFILALGLHTREEMESLGFARDSVLRLCHKMMCNTPKLSGSGILGSERATS
uniref:Uncharacterized protein n=1 Tax=Tanacetum cinerariifolium TaxID=118510 RepID=A0A699HD92_TANCI|nr:hypothetical protein [Tanacetum cinerariifolium]